ncbi:MAG: beta-Ala-His dipeptidase [Dorea sp.]
MNMMFHNTLEERPLFFFEQITRIPRDSGNEKGISNFIRNWAEQQGLWCFQDENWNLIIKKPASCGCESMPAVILQAHMDMVCEKTADSTHNFDTDPIPLKIDGEWLCSAAGTSLGADNGIGVAMCMAVLASEELVHPPLEILLTVQEETTFQGAENVRWDLLEGRRLINLDHAVEHEVLTGSCGGSGVEVTFPLEQQNVPAGARCCKLSITGLPGGHSGEDIHRGHGSAIQLMTRVLRRLFDKFNISLCELNSGTSRLAISREAHAILLSTEGDIPALHTELHRLEQELCKEYQAVAPSLVLTFSDMTNQPDVCYTQSSFERVLNALSLFPDGIQQMNGAFPGMVESSNNLGIVKTEKEKIILTAEIRGGFSSTIIDLQEKIMLLSRLFGGTCRFFSQYAPWESRSDSPLRKVVIKTYRELYDKEMEAHVVHAGIECGCFLQKIPELDAISIGLDCQHFHSPQERMNIPSSKRCWKLVQTLLENLTTVAKL